jgi:hypothetical protein
MLLPPPLLAVNCLSCSSLGGPGPSSSPPTRVDLISLGFQAISLPSVRYNTVYMGYATSRIILVVCKIKMHRTGRVWASQPAKRNRRSVKEKKNSYANVMYICVSCSAVMLFTCTLVRSRPYSNEGVKCETRSVRTNSKILGGLEETKNILEKENQQEVQSKPGSGP